MPSDNDNDTHILLRLTELELDRTYMKEAINKHTETLKEVEDTVKDIKSYIDKQNGAIPHMTADVQGLTLEFRDLKKTLEKDRELAADQAIKEAAIKAESQLKIKIIWGAIGTGVATLIAVAVKLIFGI